MQEAQPTFPILFEDDHFVGINKPTGILVHRTPISEDKVFVLQLLRKQLQQRLYPVHRLDRATSGVLIFAKTSEAAAALATLFREKKVQKTYLAVVRGFLEAEGRIDYPLLHENGQLRQEAITFYQKLAEVELPIPIGRYQTARYSLLKIWLETGRRHQIRRHFSHLRHPIIGDKRHGDVKHNKYFQEQFNLPRLLLHAARLEFQHPFRQTPIALTASPDSLFLKALDTLSFSLPDLKTI